MHRPVCTDYIQQGILSEFNLEFLYLQLGLQDLGGSLLAVCEKVLNDQSQVEIGVGALLITSDDNCWFCALHASFVCGIMLDQCK